jgi:hypothetical protein
MEILDNDFVKRFFENKIKLPNREELKKEARAIKVHADGVFPQEIIEKQRPNEPKLITDFRKDVYKSITKAYFGKIVGLLSKITKAEDWQIKYPEQKGAIQKGESLEEYCEKNYPNFDSVTNMFFSLGLKKMLTHPNGAIIVLADSPTDTTEYLKPYCLFFDTDEVLKMDNDIFIGKKMLFGEYTHYFITKERIIIAKLKKVVENEKEQSKIEYLRNEELNFEYSPFIPFGGDVKDIENNNLTYTSFISDTLPAFEEAVRLYSDYQANTIMHIHPEKYVYENKECATCKGTGRLWDEDLKENVICSKINKNCSGNGYVASSPYGIYTINPQNAKEQALPTPPVGYINKPIEAVQFLKDEITSQIYTALASLGLEFLAETPASQSGIAKEYDREEINTFIYKISRHIVKNILNPIYYFINEWRYGVSIDQKIRDGNLPNINVPTKFDALTTKILSERLQNAQTNNFDYQTRLTLQIEYAKKEFGTESKEWQIIKAIGILNPLPNLTEDDKMTILSNKGTTQENYVISSNIQSFVQRAVKEVDNFLILDYKEQNQIMKNYAKEITQEQKQTQPNLPPII